MFKIKACTGNPYGAHEEGKSFMNAIYRLLRYLPQPRLQGELKWAAHLARFCEASTLVCIIHDFLIWVLLVYEHFFNTL